jgi:dienelactone hydrolase
MRSSEGPDGVVHVIVNTRSAAREGDLGTSAEASGVVLFAHGSGSSRLSPRNRAVAAELRRAGLATLLVDLLTQEEEDVDERTREHRFDIDLLASRLGDVAAWLSREPGTSELEIGCFGASTGAGAALVCAAEFPHLVGAVVSRGGRPDLAGDNLPLVRAPTLLIVGGADQSTLELNRAAHARLQCEKRLEIVPGATHLFEEPGALDTVARLARSWFVEHLGWG